MDSRFDLVIRGGMIADGTGGDLYEADIGIIGGRIAEVGHLPAGATEIVRGAG